MKTITVELDTRARTLAKMYLQTEGQLLIVLGEMRREKVFRELNFQGVFGYCEKALGLSRAQAYYFKSVVEKAEEVPEIRTAIVQGELTLSQARRIVSVITPENQKEWIAKAISLPQIELEKEVTKKNPRAFTKERIRPMTESLSELKTPIDEQTKEDLSVLKDLLSRKLGKAASLQDVVKWMAKQCREKHDPVRKAERARKKKSLGNSRAPRTGRHAIAAKVKHDVVRRDKNQCTHISPDGRRCEEKRWTQFHHVTEISKGGLNTVSNLRILCSDHHASIHELNP